MKISLMKLDHLSAFSEESRLNINSFWTKKWVLSRIYFNRLFVTLTMSRTVRNEVSRAPISKKVGGDMLRTMTVEDNLSFREMFKGHLLSEFPSMEVVEASSGEEAFKRLASSPLDLVFMDISLPGESGLHLTRKIKAEYKDVTVAMLTSYDLAEYREAAARCGANCYITKDSMKWDQISAMVRCFQRAKESIGLKPSCVRLASEGSQ